MPQRSIKPGENLLTNGKIQTSFGQLEVNDVFAFEDTANAITFTCIKNIKGSAFAFRSVNAINDNIRIICDRSTIIFIQP